ncbi:MAG: Protein translocase subunit SecA [Parcubacteria group bacterium GW2011_GWC1_41_7]|nr:MAG: Protein translocase subunit SecA [Parcubacteria group bacterium GW2011_GWC1_41_7]
MFKGFFKKTGMTLVDGWMPFVRQVCDAEKDIGVLNDDQLKAKTAEFQKNLKEKTLDDMLPEIFAVVREAAKRTLGQRHFDEQLLGGYGLYKGTIVEMGTGEGKTITATLAVYANALEKKGAHVITVNDYLAQRDAAWMGQIYHFLGLSVGCIVHDSAFMYDPTYIANSAQQTVHSKTEEKEREEEESFKVFHEFLRPISRKEAYALDIVYGTNHEFGFDYLRDNLAVDADQVVQRELNFAIIDEVDSILIDEARTPLIISSYEKEADSVYRLFDEIAHRFEKEVDFTVDEKKRSVYLTEEGQEKLEKVLNFNPYEVQDMHSIHHLEEALKANYLFHKDKDYVVHNGQVVIVDEFTGRMMWGRRWSGGVHQAVEAKEKVAIQPESKTVASITIQNFFRRYKKLSGMTGTAATSAEEFFKVYNSDVAIIPPHKTRVRTDHPDKIFVSESIRWDAVVEKIKELHEQGRPVLVGTTSIEKNELLFDKLQKAKVSFKLLNAKNHEEEGEVIAQAGRFEAVTVATNMAGRGVDIILGGHPYNEQEAQRVKDLGGLFVLGTERHEARRIDNQLRGRAGRQGDPGETHFYISLDDPLVKIFGGEMMQKLIERFNLPKDQPIEHSLVSKAIEEAQAKVEGINFDMRRHLIEYDDVINKQREKIYAERRAILTGDQDPQEQLKTEFNVFLKEAEEETIRFVFGIPQKQHIEDGKEDDVSQEESSEEITEKAQEIFEKEIEELKTAAQDEYMSVLKISLLRIYDYLWAEHLSYLDEMKESVGYRAYGQKDPLVEYKREALEGFDNFHKLFRINLFQYLLNIRQQGHQHQMITDAGEKKIGRNDPCPCGSGKKYKKCHGA